ncbi:DUF1772 domain-containing protein [Saccharomonospora saliphila]|uniref:DUF1772 domain-containing protein n=1 Tax=Saccharomonospora saliphila TaxID=369829 RepID=UPI00037DA120|nr:DUF1772 domain-containing protein [Saccharomonospora saliphila]
MRSRPLSLPALLCYAAVALAAFGGILAETVVIYPNAFHDVPASLAGAMEFFTVTGPANYFPPLGAVTVLLGITALALSWGRRPVRWWVAASLVSLVVGEFLFSVVFFWPRNELMFTEGIAVHSAEVLRRAATEFETGHLARVALSGVTAALAGAGFLRAHRESVVDEFRAGVSARSV